MERSRRRLFPLHLVALVALLLLPTLGFAQDIGIYGAAQASYRTDVRDKIASAGSFTTVDVHECNSTTPTLAELQQYSVVFVFSDNYFADPVAMGNVLADYVDAGGNVVLATFAMWGSGQGLGLRGRFISAGYSPFTGSGQASPSSLTLVADQANHPILSGVNSFDGGSNSYHNTNIALTSGTTQIARWSNGEPLVGVKTVGNSRTVALNFYPPSSDASGSFWVSSTDGAKLMVNAINWTMGSAPVGVADSYSTDEDTTLTQAAPGVLANDTDADGDTLSVAGVVSDVSNGTLTLNSDGSFDYVPDANFNGSDSFEYTVSDGTGFSSTGVVSITVAAVNDTPTATDDSYTIDEDTLLTVSAPGLLGNDLDVDGNTLSATVDSAPVNGTVSINGTGGFTYAPDNDFAGTDSFTYQVSDGSGGTDTATVDVTVNNINDAPVADDDAVTTDEEVALTVDVLANDVDADADALSVTVTTPPANGSTTVNGDNTVEYAPVADFFGTDTFTYEVADGSGSTDSATVTVTVNNTNDAPVASDDAATTDEEVAVTVDVLANDVDVDGDTLSVTVSVPPANGSASVNADGTVEYTPATDFFGTDAFAYRIDDGNGGSDTGTANITVANLSDAPVFVSPTPEDQHVFSALEGEELAFTLQADDPDGDALTYAVAPLPNGASFDDATGEFSWTPTWLDAGSYSLALEASDGQSSDTRSIAIEVSYLDEDADELPDTWEADNGLDPTTTDSDGDTITDADEVGDDLAAPDTDSDGTLDAADEDSDDDGILDIDEAGDADLATAPVDTDVDGTPDYLDEDSDDDGVDDADDNCRLVDNPEQVDSDQNGQGDLCDGDLDGDGVANEADNCPAMANDDQADLDGDDEGDVCDGDLDGDSVDNDTDNCPLTANADQLDTDADGEGDVCDETPGTDSTDSGEAGAAEDSGCGCSSTGAPSNGLLALLVLLGVWAPRLRRRRRE